MLPAHTLDSQTFNAGEELVVGTLYLPEGAGWYPAVVVVPDPAVDTDLTPLLRLALDHGYAVFSFEPASAGLAPTALAAADSLLMRPDIRADVIGLVGYGAGAWVAAFAAARVPETAFAVLLPGDSPLPPDLKRLGEVYCPVLAFVADEATGRALAGALAHNADAVIERVAGADVAATLLAGLGPWLARQAA